MTVLTRAVRVRMMPTSSMGVPMIWIRFKPSSRLGQATRKVKITSDEAMIPAGRRASKNEQQ
jgi:hypothetical protein